MNKIALMCIASLVLVFVLANYVSGQCGCNFTSSGRKRRSPPRLIPGKAKGNKHLLSLLKRGGESSIVTDMIFLEKDRKRFGLSHKKEKRSATPVTEFTKQWDLWPNKVVNWYYKGAGSGVTETLVKDALAQFQSRLGGCITFNQITSPSGDYVEIMDGGDGVCSSYVGRIGGKQELSLGAGCDYPVIVQHEIMHALGFYHEQNRADRDTAVKLLAQNIHTYYCDAFALCNDCTTYTPYNTQGIMQYPSYAFTCDGQDTMLTKSGEKIPYNHVIQDTDVTAIKKLYGCT